MKSIRYILPLLIVTTTARPPLAWEDEFDGTVLDESVWNVAVNCWGNGGSMQRQCYARDNVHVENGTLHIVPRPGPYSGTLQDCTPWLAKSQPEMCTRTMTTSSGQINTYGKLSVGVNSYVEVSAKLPRGRYMWPAVWLLAESEKGRMAELDLLEAASGKGPAWTETTVHYQATNGSMVRIGRDHSWNYNTTDGHHTYGLDFGVDTMTFYQDDVVTVHQIWYSNLTDQSFHMDRFYVIANVAVGGLYFGLDDIPSDEKLLSDGAEWTDMEVDYIRVYGNVTRMQIETEASSAIEPSWDVMWLALVIVVFLLI